MRFLEKLWKIVRNHRDIKVTTMESRRNYFVPEPNYHTKIINNRNENNTNIHEQTSLLRPIDIRKKENSHL